MTRAKHRYSVLAAVLFATSLIAVQPLAQAARQPRVSRRALRTGSLFMQGVPLRATGPVAPYDWAMLRMRVDVAHAQGITGKGVRIAIVDTGVISHFDLRNLRERLDFTDDHAGYDELNLPHATMMQGVAGANGQVKGVAPDAEFYSHKIVNRKGDCEEAWAIKGLRACLGKVDIVSLSLSRNDDAPALRDAIAELERAGIFVATLSGNTAPLPVEAPGRYLSESGACVSACDANGRHAKFANAGPEVTVAAPGVDVRTTGIKARHVVISGGSAAAAAVAGLAALVIQAHPEYRGHPDLIREEIEKTAEWLPGMTKEEQGAGLANARAAGAP